MCVYSDPVSRLGTTSVLVMLLINTRVIADCLARLQCSPAPGSHRPAPVCVCCGLTLVPRGAGSRQHQVYHSQRSGRLGLDPRTADWPGAGFFEYESVQAVMRLGGGGGGGVSEHYSNRSLPRHHERMRSGPHPGYPAPGEGSRTSEGCWGGWVRRLVCLFIPVLSVKSSFRDSR